MSRLEQLAKEKPEIRRLLDDLIKLYTEHTGCCWEIGMIFKRIRDKLVDAEPTGLTEKQLEPEASSLKAETTRNSTVCYAIGVKYNELLRLVGENNTEVLKDEYQRVTFGDVAVYGNVAERFNEEQTIKYGMEKMARLVEYADLNRIFLRDANLETLEISLIQEHGGWKKSRFRTCSVADLTRTVVALKAQRGIPVENTFALFYLE